MSIDFLIGAMRASRDIHPAVMTEIEEILRRSEPETPTLTQKLGFPVKYYNCRRCGGRMIHKSHYCEDCGQAVNWR